MVMSWIWTAMALVSFICAWLTGQMPEVSSAILQGAQSGVTLTIAMAGSICLWSGIGNLMDHIGLTDHLSIWMQPVLGRLFPDTLQDPALARDVSANFCANLLGLGNAATPMGISAAKRMARGSTASDQLCRLIVLNTASIQLIPANVAAVRSSLGCSTPFDILPAVWISSICSAGLGLTAAWCLRKVWPDD